MEHSTAALFVWIRSCSFVGIGVVLEEAWSWPPLGHTRDLEVNRWLRGVAVGENVAM